MLWKCPQTSSKKLLSISDKFSPLNRCWCLRRFRSSSCNLPVRLWIYSDNSTLRKPRSRKSMLSSKPNQMLREGYESCAWSWIALKLKRPRHRINWCVPLLFQKKEKKILLALMFLPSVFFLKLTSYPPNHRSVTRPNWRLKCCVLKRNSKRMRKRPNSCSTRWPDFVWREESPHLFSFFCSPLSSLFLVRLYAVCNNPPQKLRHHWIWKA